eukprot:TRINITY_DN24520_c0_g1_i1.p1 TRINITY_DN24520_c0_g1~~TRINITY_DN24520_c0_g1_i1.p1  ORF type:complete len:274 (+),score=51.06 TRINITY_DN24520_c0_g1_i1:74-823(+)
MPRAPVASSLAPPLLTSSGANGAAAAHAGRGPKRAAGRPTSAGAQAVRRLAPDSAAAPPPWATHGACHDEAPARRRPRPGRPAPVQGIQFHGSGSLVSVHVIDQELPADLRLSRAFGATVASAAGAHSAPGALGGGLGGGTTVFEKTLHPRMLERVGAWSSEALPDFAATAASSATTARRHSPAARVASATAPAATSGVGVASPAGAQPRRSSGNSRPAGTSGGAVASAGGGERPQRGHSAGNARSRRR